LLFSIITPILSKSEKRKATTTRKTKRKPFGVVDETAGAPRPRPLPLRIESVVDQRFSPNDRRQKNNPNFYEFGSVAGVAAATALFDCVVDVVTVNNEKVGFVVNHIVRHQTKTNKQQQQQRRRRRSDAIRTVASAKSKLCDGGRQANPFRERKNASQ
jgi:hypothetical protein